jgi:hypothetical protein
VTPRTFLAAALFAATPSIDVEAIHRQHLDAMLVHQRTEFGGHQRILASDAEGLVEAWLPEEVGFDFAVLAFEEQPVCVVQFDSSTLLT